MSNSTCSVGVLPNQSFHAVAPCSISSKNAMSCSWHCRYKKAAKIYADLDLSSKLLDALAEGFLEWASMLPQQETDHLGRYKQVNSWGLGPELNKLRSVEMMLDLHDDTRFCSNIRGLAKDLHKSAKCLDECYPKLTEDEDAAECRLVLTCQLMSKVLANAIRQLKKPLFGVGTTKTVNHTCRKNTHPLPLPASDTRINRKRASRAANIEALKLELIAHIKSARDFAYVAIDMNRPPSLLPRPSKSEFGRRIGVPPHTVTRCFKDASAHELRLLWKVAEDIDAIIKYGR